MKGTASLSSALLARKGTAAPVGHAATYQVTDATPRPRAATRANDDAVAPAPAERPDVARPSVSCVQATPCAEPAAAAQDRKKLVKVSLRLDPARHLRLRLSAAHLRQSAQQLLLAALDSYLDEAIRPTGSSGCACLQAQVEKPTPAE